MTLVWPWESVSRLIGELDTTPATDQGSARLQLVQRRLLLLGERPDLSRCKVSQFDGAELHTHKPVHFETDRLAHAPHLAVAPFGEGDGEIPAAAADLVGLDLLRPHHGTLQLDPLPQILRRKVAFAEHGGDVRALHFVARMREPM